MQKDNFKFVNDYLKRQEKKKCDNWMEDSISFLKDAIDIQIKFINRKVL